MPPQNYSVQLTDTYQLQSSTRRYTSEGFLRALAVATRAGTQYYPSAYLGLPGPERMVGLYRPPEAVFHTDTKDSIRGKAVTRDHPQGRQSVTPENWKELAVGHAGDEVQELEDGRLAVWITITDPDTIQDVENGIDEISMGSKSNFSAFVADDGAPLDYYYVDSAIDINHIALIPPGQGRAGRDVRIMDSMEAKMEHLTNTQPPAQQPPAQNQHLQLPYQPQPQVFDNQQQPHGQPPVDPQPVLPQATQAQQQLFATWPYGPQAPVFNPQQFAGGQPPQPVFAPTEQAQQGMQQAMQGMGNPPVPPPAPGYGYGPNPGFPPQPPYPGVMQQQQPAAPPTGDSKTQPIIEDTQNPAAFEAAVARRLQLITDCAPFLDDATRAKAQSMSERDLLIEATKDVVSNGRDMADDFLRGILTMKMQRTQEAEQTQDSIEAAWQGATAPPQQIGDAMDPWSGGVFRDSVDILIHDAENGDAPNNGQWMQPAMSGQTNSLRPR